MGNAFGNFFGFRTMVTPSLMAMLYIAGTIGMVFVCFVILTDPLGEPIRLRFSPLLIIGATIAGLFVLRLWCETMVVLFAIHHELVRANTRP